MVVVAVSDWVDIRKQMLEFLLAQLLASYLIASICWISVGPMSSARICVLRRNDAIQMMVVVLVRQKVV